MRTYLVYLEALVQMMIASIITAKALGHMQAIPWFVIVLLPILYIGYPIVTGLIYIYENPYEDTD